MKHIKSWISILAIGTCVTSIGVWTGINKHTNYTKQSFDHNKSTTAEIENNLKVVKNTNGSAHISGQWTPQYDSNFEFDIGSGKRVCVGNNGKLQLDFDMNLDLLQQKYPLYQTLQTMPFKVLADQGIITNQNVSMQNFDKSGGSGGATAKGWALRTKGDFEWGNHTFNSTAHYPSGNNSTSMPVSIEWSDYSSDPSFYVNYSYSEFSIKWTDVAMGFRLNDFWSNMTITIDNNNTFTINDNFSEIGIWGNSHSDTSVDNWHTDGQGTTQTMQLTNQGSISPTMLNSDSFDKRYLTIVDPIKTGEWIDSQTEPHPGEMRGHFGLQLNKPYIGATLMAWDTWDNELANYHQDPNTGTWTSNWQNDQTHIMLNWYNKMITTYGDGTEETVNRFNAIDQAIKEGKIINQTMSDVIDWQIPNNPDGETVNNYDDDQAQYSLDNFLRLHFSESNFNQFQSELESLPVIDWKTNADKFGLATDGTQSSLGWENYSDTIESLLSQNITYNWTYQATNDVHPTYNLNGTLTFSLPELCGYRTSQAVDPLSCDEIQADNDGQDSIEYAISECDATDQTSFGGWDWPTGGKDHLGLYGKGISDSSAQIYNLNGDKIFTYKIQPFADVDAIQFANLDQISQTNTVEPSYLINPATPGNCKYNGGTGDWDETTWTTFLNYLYSLPADQIAAALTARQITPPTALGLGTVVNFDYHVFMWVKPDYQSEITSVDNLIDTTQPITYSGSATNGTLTINFTTMDGVAQTMNDMTFAKQFQIWNTNLWDKPNNDPSYYADPNNVNDFWSQLINYNQTVPTPGGHGQSYLWETNISQQAFQSAFSGSPDFSGTSDDSDTLQVTFGNMWKYIPSFLWRQITPDDADRANVTITSTNFAPTESIHESFQNDKQSYIQNNVAYIVKDKYHAIVIAGVKNDAGDTAQWFYSYNGVENNTTPPDGVTVSAGNPYTQDDVTYYPMTYTLTNDIQSDFSFVVWSKAGTHGSLADGLQITATTTPPTPAHNSSSQVGIIVGSILGGSLVIAGGTVGTIYIKRRRGSSGTKSESRKTKRQRATDFNE